MRAGTLLRERTLPLAVRSVPIGDGLGCIFIGAGPCESGRLPAIMPPACLTLSSDERDAIHPRASASWNTIPLPTNVLVRFGNH